MPSFSFLHRQNQSTNRIEPSPDMQQHHVSIDDSLRSLSQGLKSNTNKTTRAAKGVIADFSRFLNRGNVVDMAVGIVMGSAFTSIVNSLVNDMFLPFISLATPTQLSNQFILLRCPRWPNNTEKPCNKSMYVTPNDAKNAGAISWNWGQFVQMLINFVIIAIAVFFIVKTYTRAFRRDQPPHPPTTKPCPLCTKDIPIKAKRCPECTADLPDAEKDSEDNDQISKVEMIQPAKGRD